MQALKGVAIALSALLMAGCTSIPKSGPLAGDIDPRSDNITRAETLVELASDAPVHVVDNIPQMDYELADLDSNSAEILRQAPITSFSAGFGDKREAPAQEIGVGDVLAVTVFESGHGGLFSASGTDILNGSRSVTLPNQTVDTDGMFEMPYAGRILAAGRTPAQIANETEKKLAPRAIEPKVIVTVVQNASNQAAVLGEVGSAKMVPLGIRGERLLSVIASAGGSRVPEHETLVSVQRGDRTMIVPLRTIIRHPQENIFVQPDDTILLLRSPQDFTALGAVTRQGNFPLDALDMSIADGLGKAGGLFDSRADVTGLFLIRYEDPGIATEILGREPNVAADHRGIPMVYRINMADPHAMHWLSTIALRNKDVIYVSNSPLTEFDKLLQIFRDTTTVVRTIDQF